MEGVLLGAIFLLVFGFIAFLWYLFSPGDR